MANVFLFRGDDAISSRQSKQIFKRLNEDHRRLSSQLCQHVIEVQPSVYGDLNDKAPIGHDVFFPNRIFRIPAMRNSSAKCHEFIQLIPRVLRRILARNLPMLRYILNAKRVGKERI